MAAPRATLERACGVDGVGPAGGHGRDGNGVHVNIDCDSVDEIERIFKAMSVGSKVTMPLADTFWGAKFGMLTDAFGVKWMFNCELKRG